MAMVLTFGDSNPPTQSRPNLHGHAAHQRALGMAKQVVAMMKPERFLYGWNICETYGGERPSHGAIPIFPTIFLIIPISPIFQQ